VCVSLSGLYRFIYKSNNNNNYNNNNKSITTYNQQNINVLLLISLTQLVWTIHNICKVRDKIVDITKQIATALVSKQINSCTNLLLWWSRGDTSPHMDVSQTTLFFYRWSMPPKPATMNEIS